MQVKVDTSNQFVATIGGATIEIDRDPTFPGRDFFILVWDQYGGLRYEAWSRIGVTTMAEAVAEAISGARLDERPIPQGIHPQTALEATP